VLLEWLIAWDIECIREFYIGPFDLVGLCGPGALMFLGIMIYEKIYLRRHALAYRLSLRSRLLYRNIRLTLIGLPKWSRTTFRALRRGSTGSAGREMV